MVVLRRCALSLSLVLVFAPGLLPGAEVPGEAAAFNPACNQLHDGFWQLAEAGFAEFALKFTNSTRLAQAYLYQAQARYEMTNYAGAINLLLAHQGQAGEWGDQYLFSLGQACLQKGDYPAAGSAFSNLVSRFPNSTRCLEASVGEATAWAKRGQWPRVIELLQKPEGVFQSMARTNSATNQVQSGYLRLAEAFFTRQDYASADSVLQPWGKVQRNPRLDWQWQDLLRRIRLAQARPQDALQYTTNLLAAAAATTDQRLLAESFVFHARLLEQLGRPDEAIGAYTNNLAAGAPPERQLEALDKITGLLVASNRIAEAVQRLEEFSDRVTNTPPADFALLLVGELRLTNLAAVLPANTLPASTNLQRAVQALRDLEKWFPQSPLAGRGQLDLAWCLWQQQDWAGCQAACTNALEHLTNGLDQATARFKLADAQFEQTNFPGAISNYTAIVERYGGLPEVRTNLFEPALYQAVRAALEAGDLATATNALAKILAWFPDGFHAERASLFAGQAMSRSGDPARAQQILAAAAQRVPAGPLLPRLRLAIARSFELENKLPEAIQVLTDLVEHFPKCDALPQAQVPAWPWIARWPATKPMPSHSSPTSWPTSPPMNSHPWPSGGSAAITSRTPPGWTPNATSN